MSLLRLATVVERINDRIGRAVTWLSLGMILVGAYNAVARYMDRHLGTALSANTYLELQWYMFSVLFLLGAAWTLRHDAHVRVDVLYSRLNVRSRAWIDLLGSLLFLIPFSVLMIWTSWPSVVESWELKEMSPDPGGLPRYPLRAVIPLAFFLLLLQGIAVVLKKIALLRGETTGKEEEVHEEKI